MKTKIASLDNVPVTGLRFTYHAGPFDEEGLLFRLPSGEVRAYKNECRHLPMPLDEREPRDLWDSDRRYLVCSSHGAHYQPEDGLCVLGPCKGSHLRSLPVEVVAGDVLLDTSGLGSFFDV